MDINKDILFEDFIPIEITKEMREDVLEHPEKYINCPLRVRMGLFYTAEEKEKYFEESLKRSLPGDKQKVKKLTFIRKK